MFAENHGVMQERGATTRRRWFEDEAMELIVWYRENHAEGFQICYRGEDRRERALTWREGQGFSHARIDPGDSRPDKNLTPILVRDGAVPWDWVQVEFGQRAEKLEPAVRDLVLAALANRTP